MTICLLIDPVSVGYGAVTGAILGTCIYCIWNGHKIMKSWTDKNNKIPSVPSVSWEEDNDNPANWYLKNPGRIK